jgi:hypothetical protein
MYRGFQGSESGGSGASACDCAGKLSKVTLPQSHSAVPLGEKSPSHEGILSISQVGDTTPGMMMSWTDLCAASAAANASSR